VYDAKGLALNLLSEMVGALVTVCCLGWLIRDRKYKKIKEVNKNVAAKIRGTLVYIGMRDILVACGMQQFYDPNYNEDVTLQTFKDPNTRNNILNAVGDKFSSFSEEGHYFVLRIEKIFESLFECMNVLLKQVKPYPCPAMEEKVFGFLVAKQIIAAHYFSQKAYLKDSISDAEKEKIIENKINPQLRTEFDTKIKAVIARELETILDLRNQADRGDVSYDFD